MRFRNLRIAWSVFWGVACVLLVVLWVRSYWRLDVLSYDSRSYYSADGELTSYRRPGFDKLYWKSEPIEEATPPPCVFNAIAFKVYKNKSLVVAAMPHWSGVLLLCGLAAGPWLRWRFSLRTLLIATTVVAVVLGLAVYAPSN